jgi:hypothetical protein
MIRRTTWKYAHPNPKPNAYSRRKSGQKAKANPAPMAAPTMIPMPSPAAQCIVDPITWRHRTETYSSWVPSSGSRHPST